MAMPGNEMFTLNNSRRQCGICGSHNIITAKFCGGCGSPIVIEATPTDDSARSAETFETADPVEVRVKPVSRRESALRWVVSMAFVLLLLSGILSYLLLNNNDSVRVSPMPFSDVATDHPVYRVCQNLVEIKAIGYRKTLELAPHETISAAEWNYSLAAVGRHLGQTFPATAFFQEGATVTAATLAKRVMALHGSAEGLTDASRIKAFFHLEQAVFNQRVAP